MAEVTGKRHDSVLRDIDVLRESLESQPTNLWRVYFQEVSSPHPTVSGQTIRSFRITRDGMALLVMGYTTPRAMEFKLAFIARFNEMEEERPQAA